jgi:hypothetical protein
MSQPNIEKVLDKHAHRLSPVPVGFLTSFHNEGVSDEAVAISGSTVEIRTIDRFTLLVVM